MASHNNILQDVSQMKVLGLGYRCLYLTVTVCNKKKKSASCNVEFWRTKEGKVPTGRWKVRVLKISVKIRHGNLKRIINVSDGTA